MTPGASGTDPLLEWRSEFPILSRTTYLVSHSLGAMPRAAARHLQEYADTWAERGVRAWAEGWWEMPLSVGDRLAPIVGAAPRSIAMHQNVSVCQALILSCFEFTGRRNKIVYDDLNFPSVMYVYESHRSLGARVAERTTMIGGFVPALFCIALPSPQFTVTAKSAGCAPGDPCLKLARTALPVATATVASRETASANTARSPTPTSSN